MKLMSSEWEACFFKHFLFINFVSGYKRDTKTRLYDLLVDRVFLKYLNKQNSAINARLTSVLFVVFNTFSSASNIDKI